MVGMAQPLQRRSATLPEQIVGPRLELRIWDPALAEALSAAVANSLAELRPFMKWADQEPMSLADRRRLLETGRRTWSEGGDGSYAIVIDGRVIGACGLHHRGEAGQMAIGYWVDSDHTGRGYATEVARLLTDVALAQPGITSVAIHHERANRASGRVAARAGFVFAGQRASTSGLAAGDGVEWIWRAMTLPGFAIRPEEPGDFDGIASVVEAAFGSPAEAKLVADIRASPHYVPDMALLAEIDDPNAPGVRRPVGHVMISGCVLRADDGTNRGIKMLSPLAVDPRFHRHGIGGALVKAALDRAHAAGEPLVVLEGSPHYYRRFGFEPAHDHGILIRVPDWAPPEAGQVCHLSNADRSLTGTVVYPAAFDGLE